MTRELVGPIIRFLSVLAAAVVVLAVLERRWQILTRFRRETADAPDLAIARITVMALVLWQTRLPILLRFARLDAALIVPPRGWSHLANLVPLDSTTIVVAYGALLVSASAGLVGWNGRLMCGLTALLAFYLHTIPQLFGKVNHTANHLVLFSALLAAAPSCDALAVDAIGSAADAADHGLIPRPSARRSYSFALQTMMLAIGLAYFFPGGWKLARSGARWFTSENLSWLILSRLREMPMTALHRWVLSEHWLIWCMAAATIAFELGFVFTAFSSRLRPFAAFAGIVFHSLTALVMGVRFTALQLTYVVFFPWTRYLRWYARRSRLRRLRLAYDFADAAQRRLVAIIVANDWLDLIRPVRMTRPDLIAATAHSTRSDDAPAGSVWIALNDADGGTSSDPGVVASAIAARVPVLWPVQRLVERSGVRRALLSVCGVLTGRHPPMSDPRRDDDRDGRAAAAQTAISLALRWTAAAIVAAMVVTGSTHTVRTWPIACYPTFDVPATPFVKQLTITAMDRSDRTYKWSVSFDPVMGRWFESDRWRGLAATFVDDTPAFSKRRASALLSAWQSAHATPDLRSAAFYADTYSLITGRDTPLRRRLVGEWAAADDSGSARETVRQAR
jgi:hypothetical protein